MADVRALSRNKSQVEEKTRIQRHVLRVIFSKPRYVLLKYPKKFNLTEQMAEHMSIQKKYYNKPWFNSFVHFNQKFNLNAKRIALFS